MSVTSTRGALELLTSCLDPHGSDRPRDDKSPEYVLFRRSGSVADLTLEHRVKHHGHGGETYSPLYHFPHDLPKHISEVLIRNGHGTDREDGARFIGYTRQDRWLLNNQGERLRVVNSAGTVLATFDVPARTCQVLPPAPRIIGAGAAAAAFGAVF